MKTYHPSEMPSFMESASKTTFQQCVKSFEGLPTKDVEGTSSIECDRNKEKRGRKPVTTYNSVQPFMRQYYSLNAIPVDVMYVIEGVARLDWYSRGDAKRKNVVAPHPAIQHPLVKVWSRVFVECDRNKKPVLDERFTQRKYNDYGEWFLSPAGDTRKAYLIDLNKTDDHVTALSVKTLVRILKELSEVSSKEIQALIGVSERQARRYNQAVKIMIPFIERALKSHFEFQVELYRIKYQKACVKDKAPWTLDDEESFLQGIFDSHAVDSVGGGTSEYYRESICGVYVPHYGIQLGAFNIGHTELVEDFDDFGIDEYLLAA